MIFSPSNCEDGKTDDGENPQHGSNKAKRAAEVGDKQPGDHRREAQEKADGASMDDLVREENGRVDPGAL